VRVLFLGASTCIPSAGRETSSLLINGRLLVDTGWSPVAALRAHGADPLAVEAVLVTHFHQDHYIGLPHLLFHQSLTRGAAAGKTLHVAGPSAHAESVLRAANEFLQVDRFPELASDVELLEVSENQAFMLCGLEITSLAVPHKSGKGVPEQAFAYRILEPATGAEVVLSGDTSYHPPLADFARGARMLIHDAAHTTARDAAETARKADVDRLLLTHYPMERADAILSDAAAVFAMVSLATEGMTIEL